MRAYPSTKELSISADTLLHRPSRVSLMNASYPEDDDQVALSVLTDPTTNKHKSLSQDAFAKIRDRLFADTASPVSGISNDEFWNEVVSKTSSLGFTFQQHNNNAHSQQQASVSGNDTFPAPFDSDGGEQHLTAASSLLGISQSAARKLTSNVFYMLKKERRVGGSSNDENDDSALHKLFGTKRLLLRVRDYHYAQQISRIRIIAESLRLECVDEFEGRGDLRHDCISFLNSIDAQNTWSSSSRGGGQYNRGLFQLLLSLACAPVKVVGREELYKACELRDDASDSGFVKQSNFGSLSQDFARQLMAEHLAHNDSVLRTEALDALFMLLYQRIDGGIDRGDYVLLLQALGTQAFFADCEGSNGNRRSQQTALILAECMGLWRTAASKSEEETDSWFASHPFLSNPSCAQNEIELIGRHLLQQELASKVLERRRICIMQSEMSAATKDDNENIEAPEAIALLTFGLLMKLSHNHCVEFGNWAADIAVKGLAVDCVSMANDDCGAFEYLGTVMNSLLPKSSAMDAPDVKRNLGGRGDAFDRSAFLLSKAAKPGSSPFKITNGAGEDSNQNTEETEEESSTVIYASIGREILVATLSAFRTSLSRSLSPPKVDNLGMFCHLAAKIHRNSNVLCQRFWSDWEATPQSIDVAETNIITIGADPLVYLLDIAHSVAMSALATLESQNQGSNFVSTDCGRQESAILPCLSPLLSILSSLISKESDVFTIMTTFIPDRMIHACLLGCYHLCLQENSLTSWNGEKEGENKRLAEAARIVMQSLHVLSSIGARENSSECTEWLRQATQNELAVSNLHGAALLHGIAVASNSNSTLDNTSALDITSDTLYTIAYLCCPGNDSHQWMRKVGQCFSSAGDEGFRSFAAHINKVTASSTFLLCQMSLCVADIAVNGDATSTESTLDFMKTSANGAMLACDIISSAPQSLDLSDIHRCIITNALSNVTSTLRIIDGVASCHENETIRDAAKSIRDGMLNALSTSTALGSNIGFFATIPVSNEIAEAAKNRSADMESTPKSLSVPYYRIEEKKEAHHNTVVVDTLPIPDTCNQSTKNMVNLSHEAMSLLRAWSDASEKYAFDSLGVSLNGNSPDLIVRNLSVSQRRSLASDLVSFGPSRLLLSSVTRPNQVGPWTDSNTPVFSVLARLVGWYVEDASDSSDIFADIALAAVELMTSTIFHSTIDMSNELIGASLAPLIDQSTQSAGLQLHQALRALIDVPTKTSGEKRTLLLVKILDFARLSICFHPRVGKLILSGPSDEDSLIESMLKNLDMKHPVSRLDATITSSCLQVFSQLWDSCRGIKAIHPCDEIVRSLLSSQRLINCCVAILEKLPTFVQQISYESDDADMDAIAIYHHCTLVSIVCTSTKVIEIDASFHLQKTNQAGDAASLAFLKSVAQGKQLEQWLHSIESYNGILSNVKASDRFNGIVEGRRLALSPIALTDASATMLLIGHLPNSEIKESLGHTMICFDATCHLMTSQSNLVVAVSTFGELLLASVRREEPTAGSGGGDDSTMSIARQAVQNFFDIAECGITAYSHTASSSYSVPVFPAVTCGNVLLNLIMSCLSKLSKESQVETEVLIELMDKILRSSERYLVLAESAPCDSSSICMHLRLNTECCAISIINAIRDYPDSTSHGSGKLFKAIRLGLCRFSCGTLSQLKCTKGEDEDDTLHIFYNYDATSERHNSNTRTMEVNTLHSSISLLTVLALSSKGNDSIGISFSLQSFESDLAATLMNSGALQSLSYHLEFASNSAAAIYRQKGSDLIRAAAFETVERILAFASLLCESANSDLVELVLNSRFIQLILKNAILTTACEEWTIPKNGIASQHLGSRGYIERSPATFQFTSRSQHDNITQDPAHNIWRSTLRTVAALLHATSEAVPGNANTEIRQHSAALAIDFLHFFEIPITSFVEKCLAQSPQSPESNSSTPSSGLGFTVATMSELSEILALVSELCYGDHRKQFESSSARLFQIMSMAALAISRSLSSFLGALGTARELFTALTILNEVMGKDMNQSAAVMQYQNFSSHPLLADGVPNAKHQAIRNALYASSCCTYMTADERNLSRSGKAKEDSQVSSEDLEQSFHSHVSNDFIYLMEDIASQCMFSALSVIHRVHPSTSSFVTFTEHEAAQLNLSSVPPIGAMVAIRSGSGNQIAAQFSSSSGTTRYGRVIHYNSIARTLDVEYFDKQGCAAERHIGLARVAALEDITKRINVFQYKPAPDSVSDSVASFTGDASIGNLILILRWCQQHAASQKSNSSEGRSFLQMKSIANLSSIILGNEISLHLELGSPAFASVEEAKSINRQLLALCDDEVTLQNFDLSVSTNSLSKSAILQGEIDKEVWMAVQCQLETSLIAARADRDIAKENAEQLGSVGTLYWGRTPSSPGRKTSRRSPFG